MYGYKILKWTVTDPSILVMTHFIVAQIPLQFVDQCIMFGKKKRKRLRGNLNPKPM